MSAVLAIAEHRDGALRSVTHELVTAGRDIANETGGDLHVAVVGSTPDGLAAQAVVAGVDHVHAIDVDPTFDHGRYVQSAEQLIATIDPVIVLAPHSVDGMDYAPAIAARQNIALVTDATALSVDGGTLVVTREMFGSAVETTVETQLPAVVTIRPTAWPPTTTDGAVAVRAFDVTLEEDATTATVTGYETAEIGDVDISAADFVIAVGRGIEDEENLPLIEELVDATGAVLASSRPIVDNGWLPKDRQVGQSGRTVTPTVYLAIGISGAVQHVAGMKGSDTIIAINNDPNAPIFDIADYGIVGDLFEAVPALIERCS